LDLVGSGEPSFSGYVNFQSESLRDVQDIEMVQYQGMERLSQNLPAHLPQKLVEQSAPKSDGCFEHSLVHKPLPRSLKVNNLWDFDMVFCTTTFILPSMFCLYLKFFTSLIII
jgi:hypothetical protein